MNPVTVVLLKSNALIAFLVVIISETMSFFVATKNNKQGPKKNKAALVYTALPKYNLMNRESCCVQPFYFCNLLWPGLKSSPHKQGELGTGSRD
jgi:hypothetical protein